MNDQEREILRKRLLTYPGVTSESVRQQLGAYEDRENQKQILIHNRGMSNAMAEAFLDRNKYPRPPGWHAVLFYPGSYRPRNGYVVLLMIVVAAVACFAT